MTVSIMLAGKGREVVSIEPNATLAAAVGLLAEKRIGAVIILGAGQRIVGILSERDIVRAIGTGPSSVLEEPVSRYMTAKVTTVDESASIDRVMELMTEGRFRHLPVVENGRLVGIVSIGDVVKRHVNTIDSERRALRDYIGAA